MRGALIALAASGAGVAEAPPSPIRFNQAGVEAGSAARIVVADDRSVPVAWEVRDAAGRVAARGTAPAPIPDRDAGERVTSFTLPAGLPPGRYTIVAGQARSRPLSVVSRPYARLFRDAMSFFYQQRAGTPISARYVQRSDLARPAGHAHEVLGCFAGIDLRGVRWPGCPERRDVGGGWYDAGDRGKYVVNAGVSVWLLLDAFERAAGSSLMQDGALALPEAGNGVPDPLDEARWEIEWMLRMQLPAGARTTVASADGDALRTIDGGGLVFHKAADVTWAPLPIRVEDDHGLRALYPPSTAATLNLAAVAAQAARIWRTIDPAFAARCLTAARAAFAAARREPHLLADGRFTGSGGYGDATMGDEFFWAAAELLVAGGDTEARTVLERSPLRTPAPLGDLGWATVGAAGTMTLLRHPDALPPALVAAQRSALIAAADAMLADDARQPYRFPAARGPTAWGSNGGLLARGVVLGTAFDLTGDTRYRAAVLDAADYVLGRNPLDRSYVSGYGARPMRYPHHRFWAAGADPAFPLPPPGVLSGGPNSRAMDDPVARRMRGHCVPQTCWTDHVRAYTQNEVAINWNAPLVWVSAFLDTARPRGQ